MINEEQPDGYGRYSFDMWNDICTKCNKQIYTKTTFISRHFSVKHYCSEHKNLEKSEIIQILERFYDTIRTTLSTILGR